jgi:hypothetical protein
MSSLSFLLPWMLLALLIAPANLALAADPISVMDYGAAGNAVLGNGSVDQDPDRQIRS